MKIVVFLTSLLLVSCGKEASKPESKAAITKVAPEVKQLTVPQGKLPVMDPEKAKFIAVPSTPKDPEVEKAEKPTEEAKK